MFCREVLSCSDFPNKVTIKFRGAYTTVLLIVSVYQVQGGLHHSLTHSLSRKSAIDKVKIAVVNGIISWLESVSEKSELFIYFRFPSWLQSLWSSENWIVGVAGRGEKINQSKFEYSCHPIAFNPTIQFSLDGRGPHFFWFHKFDFLWIISP